MGIPEDIAALRTQITAIDQAVGALGTRVTALEARPTPPTPPTPTPQTPEQTAANVLAAVDTLTVREKKNLWRKLRDGV